MIKLKFLGRPGPAGKGVPAGGTDGQIAVKDGSTPYLTKWVTLTKALVGLGNVDNTADSAKPVSTAQAAAIAAGDATNATAISTHAARTDNPHGVTKAQVGLGSVDNTADIAKPISTLQQAALDLKAPLASPPLTGTPTAPTAAGGTNTTQIATTAFVHSEVASLVAAAPGTLDTLDELAAALGDDPNFATSIATSLAGKQPLAAELTALSAISGQSWGRALLSMISAAALRTAIALPTVTVVGRLARYTDTAGAQGSTAGLFEDGSGNVGIGGATTPTASLDNGGDTYRQRTKRTPASATAAGNAGDWCWDDNFFYVCIATNQWKRSALSTW